MTRSADLLVVGGGIAGLSTALAAAERHPRALVGNPLTRLLSDDLPGDSLTPFSSARFGIPQ
ncbi:MAG TPA: FAD-binding protein [Gemmatimonadaceae bacterium]